MTGSKEPEEFVRKIQEDTRRYVEALLKETERLAQDFALVEQQHNDLATLYIAGFRLGGIVERAEFLETIKEIVTNLIGSEHMAVYERTGAAELTRIASSGVDSEKDLVVDLERHPIGVLARRRDPYVSSKGDSQDQLAAQAGVSACIPLWVRDEVVGAVVIFSLLQQKNGWADVDEQLIELIGRQGAVAMYCTSLMARQT